MDATLHIEGRDVESQDLALQFNPAVLTWRVVGSAEEFSLSMNRQKIVNAILLSGGPMAPKAIARQTGLKLGYVETTVQRMAKRGLLTQSGRYGPYDVCVDTKVKARSRRRSRVKILEKMTVWAPMVCA